MITDEEKSIAFEAWHDLEGMMKLSERIRAKVLFWHSNKQDAYIHEDMHYWGDRIAEIETENARLKERMKVMRKHYHPIDWGNVVFNDNDAINWFDSDGNAV